MQQVKTGNPPYFGMKAHIGLDSQNELIHTVLASAANVADKEASCLLHVPG